MNISASQLAQIDKVLNDLEEGRIDVPRVPREIGQFLREFAQARTDAETRLEIDAIGQRSISGQALMPLELVPITPLEIRIQGSLIGSVTSAIAVSETLATTLRVTLWGGAQGANRLLRIWRPRPRTSVLLSGRYRWHAPSRVTPGEAKIEVVDTDTAWYELRCLKFTGDDMGQVPPAAMFHIDFLTEPYGIKAFRAVAIHRKHGRWRLVPALAMRPADVELVFPPNISPAGADQLLALVWTQPWEPSRWHVAEVREASGDDFLAHNISWADHKLELQGHGRLEGDQIRGLQEHLREEGITELSIERAAQAAPLTRRLDPSARAYAGWLRGTN